MKNNSMKTFAKQFLQEIKNHQYIVIFHHQRPDGDCLGSQQALKLWIKKMFPNKTVYAVGSNENLFPFLNWKFNKIPSNKILSKALGIVVDANYANRIICNELILENKLKTLIRIDHHPEKDDINYKLRFVDPTYSASAEQIADLIKLIAPSSLDKKISQFLYLGIYTDSGRFFYDTTTARTHALVSWLLESNFKVFDLHKNLSLRTISELEFNKYVLSNYKTHKNVIYCFISYHDIKKLKLKDNNTNRVDFLANIEGYDIWIFFIQNVDKSIRVRLRSNKFNIAQLAHQYNGGGHKKASGAIIYDEKEILEIVKKAALIRD